MILHVDMDAFYASVEQLDHPWLKGECLIVGGTSGRGVVAAASYEARRFGVRSAMPMIEARRRCPQGVFVRPRMERYQEVSAEVMGILGGFSPRVEPVSIDEAFLDLGGTERLHGAPAVAARTIKERIRQAVGLSCSIGVAPQRFLAKIASDLEKPDGLTVIGPEQVIGFIDRLAVAKVPGVGPKTLAKLTGMGVRFLGDVRRLPAPLLIRAFGSFGTRLLELAQGVDPTPVSPETTAQSISSECTLERDTRDVALLSRCLLAQADEVAAGLRREAVKARTVILKIKHADFTLATRQVTASPPAQSSKELFRLAVRLLEAHRPALPVRLIGLGASGFVPANAPRQLEVFAAANASRQEWERVDQTLESIRRKFGKAVIGRATLADDPNGSPPK
ncbi:MAG: DNA polymerase IV [Desulfobacterales bacterium]|jgi:DNA polymerase-4|nr:DNA polymerase IV [Desulfobacterales bacterium]